ncbi:transcriptional regulatory protein CutR [Longispora fulva]|uniref:DNA-binding response OmpR family regulator n=1 Tax=Longispora fulva TaxID=619741 RepID=A0A8J7KLF7_9ACTN|nr:response regulator transcription factor [Longispora fulva]MBG6137916.1 DNA-binding response OmpR family regulator [Longispora fulva]GIG60169.1 transcriptional regulatory protein CutR [Longispora fulva]
MRVLIAEDEPTLAEHIADGLRDAGMAVDVAPDGADALAKVGVNAYDVLVLDRDLPVLHGDDVCRALAGRADAPLIIMLTAFVELADRLDGLAMGADDYLGKPFAFDELVLRVRALGRRGRSQSALLRRDSIEMDTLRRAVWRDGRVIRLTAKEFAVLEALMVSDGAVVSTEDLLERVWDENTDPFTNTVRVTMNRLRRKLGDPAVIETLVGAGYRLP